MPNDRNEPAENGPPIEEAASVSDLRKASADLKRRTAEAKGRSDLPLDSTLGNPNWDSNAADGHLDVADDDDDNWPRSPGNANKTTSA